MLKFYSSEWGLPGVLCLPGGVRWDSGPLMGNRVGLSGWPGTAMAPRVPR